MSISHSHFTASCAIARSGQVGIDIEPLSQSRNWLALAESAFSLEENAEIQQSSIPAKEHFLSLWTLKEAYCKATGIPLHQILDQLQITRFPSSQTAIVGLSSGHDWYFGLFQFEDQLIALCCQSGSVAPLVFYRLPELHAEPEIIHPEHILPICIAGKR